MKKKLLFAVALSLALVSGCQNKHKQEAYDAWSNARAGVQFSMASERYKMGNLDDARKTIDEAIKLAPKNPNFRILSARIYIERNMLEAADRELATAQILAPKYAEADYLSGVVYQRWQKLDQAMQYYAAACEKAPNELSYLMARAEMLTQLGRMNEAVQLIESKLAFFEYSGPLRDELAGIYVQQGRVKEAIDLYHQATILSPDDSSIHEHLARAYFRNANYRECLAELELIIKREDDGKRADVYLLKGECLFQLGNMRDARFALETALERNPSSVAGLMSLAKVSMRSNDYERAELCLRKAQAINENDPQIYLGMGYLRMSQKRWADASVAFTKASQLDPTDPVALCMIGLVLEKQGKPDEAMTWYGKALQAKPDDKFAQSLMLKVK